MAGLVHLGPRGYRGYGNRGIGNGKWAVIGWVGGLLWGFGKREEQIMLHFIIFPYCQSLLQT